MNFEFRNKFQFLSSKFKTACLENWDLEFRPCPENIRAKRDYIFVDPVIQNRPMVKNTLFHKNRLNITGSPAHSCDPPAGGEQLNVRGSRRS